MPEIAEATPDVAPPFWRAQVADRVKLVQAELATMSALGGKADIPDGLADFRL